MTVARITFDTKDYRLKTGLRDAISAILDPCTAWFENDALMVRVFADATRGRFIDSIPAEYREAVQDVQIVQSAPDTRDVPSAFTTAYDLYHSE